MIFIDGPKTFVLFSGKKQNLSYTIKIFLGFIKKNKVYYNSYFVFAFRICITNMHLTYVSIFRNQKLYLCSCLFLKVLHVPERCYDLSSIHVKKE